MDVRLPKDEDAPRDWTHRVPRQARVELAALLLERCDKREMTDEETGEVLVEMNAIAERFGGPWVATGPSPDAGRAIFVALAELLGFELEDWVASMVMRLPFGEAVVCREVRR
jgi:hypothetical protein